MSSSYQTPNHDRKSFARTNVQTVSQRAAIIGEILPNTRSIAEVCCGDCFNQWKIYHSVFKLSSFVGLDIDSEVIAANRASGINCLIGDALDREVVRSLLSSDIIFFGPPLSANCDGHTLFRFQDVVPGYVEFTDLVFAELDYQGTIVCIGSKQTSMSDAQWLYNRVKINRPDVGLRLLHYSYSTITGAGKATPSRLKYVELWLSSKLEDSWEIRESTSADMDVVEENNDK